MKLAAILFTIFIIIVIILADRGQLGPVHYLYDFPYGDKAGHMILYGLLTFFVTRAGIATLQTRPRGRVALSTCLTLALLIGIEEWSQQFFSMRTMDLIDLTASYLGVLIGGYTAVKTAGRE